VGFIIKIPTKVPIHEPIWWKCWDKLQMSVQNAWCGLRHSLALRFLVTLVFAEVATGIHASKVTKRIQQRYKLAKLHNRLNHYIEFEGNEARFKHLAWWHKNNEALHHKPKSKHLLAQLTLSAGMVELESPKKCCIPFDAGPGAAQQSLWRRQDALISSPVSQC
jgi:hypothetical protein